MIFFREGVLPVEFHTIEIEAVADPWQVDAFACDDLHIGVSGEESGLAVCFAYGSVIADEAELLRIATLPAYRSRGLGHEILSRFLRQAATRGASVVFLEVELDNTKARRLYERMGFATTYVRNNYYGPGRHAAMMRRELKFPASQGGIS